ncbi:SMI1/KNR4 family protein [Streptomyces cupreus]|uniref:SMI1/KNR4 family protein n=1 Tax=Streptomyces cupreus TaxID=2759956 RepID=A0A7X1JC22_9ACTN|nr:SMI1/KNR4 family protein [Streptomyces cupreus]MBC2906992.1 SMI1/KNR4 family protein [Streptomyces cupreus]
MSEQVRVEAAWRRIEGWLQKYAPQSHGLLRAPATFEQIAQTERVLGCVLPPELRALYLMHDGVHGADLDEFGEQPFAPEGEEDAWHRKANAVDFMPNGQAWLPLEHVITAHGGPLSALDGQETASCVPVTASAKYTMLEGMYLDLATGLLGIWADAQEPTSLRIGLADWLEEGAAALAEGRPDRVLGMCPYMSPTGDGLTWFDPDPMYEQDGWRPVTN